MHLNFKRETFLETFNNDKKCVYLPDVNFDEMVF